MADRKSKSYKSEFKEPTPVSKQAKSLSKAERLNHLKQLRTNKLNTTILQKRGIIDKDGESTIRSINATNLTALIDYTEYTKAPILCVLIALNAEADLKKAALEISSLFEKDRLSVRCNETICTGMVPLDIVKGKERITLVSSDRSVISALDYAKVSDLIIFVSSCKADHNVNLLKKDPYSAANPIDETGYETISAIKAQNLLNHICLIQDLDVIEEKHQNPMKKLFTRYVESELSPIKTITFQNTDDTKAIIRTICNAKTYEETFNLRKHRSYMLCDNYYAEKSKTNANENNLIVHGYVKGNTLNNLNYVHLTGFGDFIALEINEEIEDPCPVSHIHNSNKNKKSHSLGKDGLNKSLNNMTIDKNYNHNVTLNHNVEIEASNKNSNDNKPHIVDDDFKLKKLQKQDQDKIDKMLDKQIEDLIDFNIDGQEEDISFHDDEEEALVKEQELVHHGYSKKHEAKTSLIYRTPEDMEVADEVDTPITIPCREMFSKYRGLSSLATGSLNPLVNLPKEYSNIYSFENIKHTFKESVKQAHENGLRISGRYVKITLKNFKDFHLLNHNKPLILSSLLNHERKLCVMHLKIKLRDDHEEAIYTKQLVEFQIGFRRNLSRPIYSSEVGETDKFKKEYKLEKGRPMIASLYTQLAFPETPVIMLRPEILKNDMKQVAIGKVFTSDCNKIILKKIVLTGYPLKIHKKRAVVRYMFFNPEDVNYFKPIPLSTKFGLRGNITESLGTHGYMKCTFNDNLKANDTVCLNLYKRVYPVWFTESWRLALGYSDSSKYYEVYREDTKEFLNKEIQRYKVPEEDEIQDKIINSNDGNNKQMVVDA